MLPWNFDSHIDAYFSMCIGIWQHGYVGKRVHRFVNTKKKKKKNAIISREHQIDNIIRTLVGAVWLDA